MTSTFPLQSLLDLSQMRLDEAARKLGKLIAGEQEASKRREILIQYREEYRARFVAAAQNGLGPLEWQNYSSFLARLDEAIVQADSAIVHTKQRTSAGQKEWLNKHGRLQAFNTLSDRHQTRVAHQDQRREQKMLDEITARKQSEKSNEDDWEFDQER